MDIDFWAARAQSSKRVTAMQAARLNHENHLSFDESEGGDDARACFPCPYCYVDIEVPVLCTHLQEEHCFDVYPVFAANLGKDIVGHFTVQHAHLLKRRRKSQRSGLRTNSSAMLGMNCENLAHFCVLTSASGRGKTPASAPDPLLTPFLFSASLPDTKVISQNTSSNNSALTTFEVKSTEPSSPDELEIRITKRRCKEENSFST